MKLRLRSPPFFLFQNVSSENEVTLYQDHWSVITIKSVEISDVRIGGQISRATTTTSSYRIGQGPDQQRPPLVMLAKRAPEETATVGQRQRRRRRGGKRVRREGENKVVVRVGTLNVGTMTGKGRELADMMDRRKVDIFCVQETKWKGNKARNIGGRFKLFYHGVDGRRSVVGVILKDEYAERVLEVRRMSDREMSVKLEVEGEMINIISAYAPQVGCEVDEKEEFWSEFDEVMESVQRVERVVIGAD